MILYTISKNNTHIMIKKLLSPQGSVHPKYIKFVSYSFATNIFLGAQAAISTHGMLAVIGQSTTGVNMSVNYIGRDIVGQMGSLVYMSKMAKYADTNTKHFVNKSMAMQQASLFVESSLTILPADFFIPIAGCSNISKGISFTCFGAVNAKAIATLSDKDDNQVGEIYSKLTIVNTLGSTIGMGLGLSIIAAFPDYESRILFMPILAAGRVWSFNKSIDGIIND